MQPFVYDQLPSRIVFGAGKVAEVGDEVGRVGCRAVMLVGDAMAAATADDIAAQLGGRCALRWSDVAQHVPVELAERARAAASAAQIDGVVCVGGGSSTGLAKVLALSHGVPIIAVPTTYAGSEQTTIYGLTGGQHKQTGKNPVVLPRTVVYDAELTLGLPPNVTGPSAFNALAHAVEALYAPGNNPITSVLAMEGVGAINDSLPRVMAAPRDVTARSRLLYGAYLSGVALGATAAAFHHKICHVLGGTFNLVHADAHSVILPHAIAFNAAALPEEMERLADALGVPGGDPAGALWDLASRSHVPTRLADLHGVGLDGRPGLLRRDDLAEAARRATAEILATPPPGNPRAFTEAELLGMLERAYEGERP